MLHMRKSLIVDLSASSVLALVELGLLAFIMHLGLLDPLKSRHAEGMYFNYVAMARSPFSSDPMVHNSPYCWRVLTPWLVHLLTKLGFSLQGGFLLITTISLCGTVIGVYALLRLISATPWQALVIALLVQTQFAMGLSGLWDYELVDPLTYLLLVLGFILYLQDKPRWLLVVLALGVLNRETALAAVVAFGGEQVINRDWRRLKAYLPAYIVPILIIIVLHVAIYNNGGDTLLMRIQGVWSEHVNFVGRDSTITLFGNVNPFALNAYHLTINSYGFLLPLLVLQVIHPPHVMRRPLAWIFLLVTAISATIIGGDTERLMIIAFPVVAIAAWYELCWIAQQIKLPAATIGFFLVLAQSLFLLGYFYKIAEDYSLVAAIKQEEPHWLLILWLLVLVVLTGAVLVAALWALGFVTRLLYQRVRV
jgi:hypothetical protein